MTTWEKDEALRKYLHKDMPIGKVQTFSLCCCCTYPICTQEGWIPPTLRQLQRFELSPNTKQVPPATYQWASWQNNAQKVVYKVVPEKWVKPDKDSSRRQVEDSLACQTRTLRVYRNAIWTDQCPCIIARNNRYHLQRYGRMYLVPQWYSYLWWRYPSRTPSHSWERTTAMCRT